MSTILDLVVVFLFTHPLVSLLSRSAAFGSARFTGLNAVREGGIAQSAPSAEQRRRSNARRRAGVVAGRNTPLPDGAIAVLDADDVGIGSLDSNEDWPDADGASSVGQDLPASSDDVDPGDAPGSSAPPLQPAAGTAAERAAARRARLREEAGSGSPRRPSRSGNTDNEGDR
jgi:preprotein translocase subunit SecD